MIVFGLVCHLELKDSEVGDAAIVAREVVEAWGIGKQHRGLQAVPPKPFILGTRNYDDGASSVWEITVSQDADEGGTWTTEVRCQAESSARRATMTIAMRLNALGSALTPLRYYVDPPAFLRQMDDRFTVRVGTSDATIDAQRFQDERSVADLVSDLCRLDRTLPIIVVTDPVVGPPTISNLPNRLASFLFGLARVVHVDRDSTFRLTDALGKEMSVFDGGLRVYWPGWSVNDPLRRHPLFLRRRIEYSTSQDPARPDKFLRGSLIWVLARACAARFAYPEPMQVVVKSAQRGEIQREFAAASPPQLATEALALRQQLAELSSLWEISEALNVLLTKENLDIREELERCRRVTGDPWEMESAEEAVDRARIEFAATLVIPENVKLDTSEQGWFWYHVLKSLHQLCEAERRGEAANKRNVLRDLLSLNGLAPKDTYKVGDTDVWVSDPSTDQRCHCRERVHVVEGKPAETESLYWAKLGDERASFRYLLGQLGRHA